MATKKTRIKHTPEFKAETLKLAETVVDGWHTSTTGVGWLLLDLVVVIRPPA